MRKLMWFTVGFAAGCIPGAYLLWKNWFVVFGILFLISAIALCFVKLKPAKVCAAVLFGLAFAVAWFWGYDGFYLDVAKQHDGKVVSADIQIADYSYDTAYGIAAEGRLKLEGKSFRVLVYLDDAEPLAPGDTVSGNFKLRLTTIGSSEGATYHQGKGIFLLVYSEGEVAVSVADAVPLRYYPAKLREDIMCKLEAVFPKDTVAFARALLLGDGTGLSYEEDTAFKISGIRHVIAVSGLHVSILFALVYFVFGGRKVINTVVGLPLLFIFAAVVGFTPSVVRACIMQALVLIAYLFDKDYDPPTALAFSVLTMLLINPMTITSVGFQLSVGCIIGIFSFYERIDEYLLGLLRCPKGRGVRARLTRWLSTSVSVTLSAMFITTPLSAIYFGTVSVIGILSNLVTLWVISFVFYGIMLSCVLGAIWLPLGRIVAFVIAWPIRYVLLSSKLIASVPTASVYTDSVYILIWLVFSYILLLAFLLSKEKKPILLTACILCSLVLSLAASYVEPRMHRMRVTVMDVGQGQSVLLESNGKRYLVDCGGDHAETVADSVSQKLLSQGITRLDGVILTHYDADHAEAVPYLLTRVKADTLYLPDVTDDGTVKEHLVQTYPKQITMVRENTVLSGEWGSLSMFPGSLQGDENQSSMCILFQTENCDILITGDRGFEGERALLESTVLPKLELLVVGHHGAAISTSFELLSATRPSCAVISVGKDNRYGHPSGDVIKRLEMFNCRILRTDQESTIIFKEENAWLSRVRRLLDFVT